MIELVRIVEKQINLSSYRATKNEERAQQLEALIELTKPANNFQNWHPLISTPFRYSPPNPLARFRPRYGKNVFYASYLEETALYEFSFHFMKQRLHLNIKTETGMRTIFVVNADEKDSVEIKNYPQWDAIMDKKDYSTSHEFIAQNPTISFIIYPSCRDPKNRNNAAVLEINHLEKMPKWESTVKYFYDNKKQRITWIDYDLRIKLDEVI